MRCWFFRSIDTGPMAVSSFIRFLAGSTWPCGVLISTSSTSVVNCRSSSRSRTMIGNSLPPWRKVAACVPATLVRIVLATVVALTPNKAALARSTRTASSGRPSSRPRRASAMPGTVSSRSLVAWATRCDSTMSSPRISSASRPPPPKPPPPPPERKRFIWLLPPDAFARTITPGIPESCRRRSNAICSLERVRSSFGVRISWMLPRLPPPPPPGPPGPKPPPPSPRSRSCRSLRGRAPGPSARPGRAPAPVTSMRVPRGSSMFTWTWPSSVCVENSVDNCG